MKPSKLWHQPLWAGPLYPHFPIRHLYSSDTNCSEFPEWTALTPVSSLLFFLPEHLLSLPPTASFPLLILCLSNQLVPYTASLHWIPRQGKRTVSSYILIVNHSPYAILHCLVFVYFPWYKLYWGQRTISHFYSQWLVQCQTQRGCSLMFEGKQTQTWTARAQSWF